MVKRLIIYTIEFQHNIILANQHSSSKNMFLFQQQTRAFFFIKHDDVFSVAFHWLTNHGAESGVRGRLVRSEAVYGKNAHRVRPRVKI